MFTEIMMGALIVTKSDNHTTTGSLASGMFDVPTLQRSTGGGVTSYIHTKNYEVGRYERSMIWYNQRVQ